MIVVCSGHNYSLKHWYCCNK